MISYLCLNDSNIYNSDSTILKINIYKNSLPSVSFSDVVLTSTFLSAHPLSLSSYAHFYIHLVLILSAALKTGLAQAANLW